MKGAKSKELLQHQLHEMLAEKQRNSERNEFSRDGDVVHNIRFSGGSGSAPDSLHGTPKAPPKVAPKPKGYVSKKIVSSSSS